MDLSKKVGSWPLIITATCMGVALGCHMHLAVKTITITAFTVTAIVRLIAEARERKP